MPNTGVAAQWLMALLSRKSSEHRQNGSSSLRQGFEIN
jgi:hypothetical protein